MYPFQSRKNTPDPAPVTSAPKPPETHPLDALTGGAFSASTSGERASRVREWLATQPAQEALQEVFKELSARDKGAARAVRERLDELRRAKGQEGISAEWAERAEALLAQARLNIADAMAWQRDAAKAGAPLSREPLAGLKTRLAERVKSIEDLQHRVQVQREAAVLLAQRIELLSTKPWRDGEAASAALVADVAQWQSQAETLTADAGWVSLEARFPPLLEASRGQLVAVWDAFSAALAQTQAAAANPAAPLPSVPVWADEIRAGRGVAPEPAAKPEHKPDPRPKVDPELRAKAVEAVRAPLARLQQEVGEGHGKASAGAAQALRAALKEHGKLIDDKLEGEVNAALAAAGELEGWQRWRADQLRMELVRKAEALVPRKGGAEADTSAEPAPAADASVETTAEAAPATAADAEPEAANAAVADAAPETANDAAVQTPEASVQASPEAGPDASDLSAQAAAETAPEAAPAATASEPADEAAALPVAQPVAQAAAQDLGATPSARPPRAPKAPKPQAPMSPRKLQETLRQLREEWKQVDQGGASNHALWKRFDEACNEAHKVVEAWLGKMRAETAEHRAQRIALIEEVKAFGAAQAADGERVDWKAVNRQLHQFSERWRAAGHLSEKAFAEMQPRWKEAVSIAHAPLEAAQKASVERRQAMIAEANELGAAPQLRVDAVRSLQQRWQAEAHVVPLDRRHEQRLWDAFRKPIDEAFNRKTADREKQSSAMTARDRAVLEASKALEAATGGGDAQQIRQAMNALDAALRAQAAESQQAPAGAPKAAAAGASDAASSSSDAAAAEGAAESTGESAPAEAPAAPKAPPKPVVAVRGDDRPGMRKSEPQAPARGRFGDRGAPRGGDRPGAPGDRRGPPRAGGDRFGDRDARGRDAEARGPRLSDAAFRAQREAVERAEATLRKLASQAHGEALSQLVDAWSRRAADAVPSQAELGRSLSPSTRGAWAQAVGQAAGAPADESLLRLEMAAEVPTPADQLDARRALQLKLLTRRNDPTPRDTWQKDVAAVLAAPHGEGAARRLQNALKVLLRG